MKTKEAIQEIGRKLFNTKGVMNVTLREVAENLDKSYGNITYHFKTKAQLIETLFKNLNSELSQLQTPDPNENLLRYFLDLPSISYDITLRYLFFSIDLLELKRNQNAVYQTIVKESELRGQKWLALLQRLRQEGYLQSTLRDADLNYILFLSTSLRSYYFQSRELKAYSKREYCQLVNLMLKPYLSSKGLIVFNQHKV